MSEQSRARSCDRRADLWSLPLTCLALVKRLTPKVSEEKLPLLATQCQGPFPVEARPAQTGHVPPRRWYAGATMVEPCSAGLEPASQTTAQGELFCLAVVLLEWVGGQYLAEGSHTVPLALYLDSPGLSCPQRPNSPIARPNSNPTPPFPAPNRSGPVSKPFLIPLGAVSALSQSRIIHIQNRGPNYVQTHLPTHIQRRAILVALLLRLLTRCNPAPASFRRPSNSIAPSASLHHLRGPILLSFCFLFVFLFSAFQQRH